MPLATVDSHWAVLAATLALILVAVTMLRRHQFRTTSLRDAAREQLARLRDQREVQAALDDLLVQLEEVSRRVAAQVETRYAKLESVIRDADQRIARLEALTRAVGSGPTPGAGAYPAGGLGPSAGGRAGPSADAGDEPVFQPGLGAPAVVGPGAPPVLVTPRGPTAFPNAPPSALPQAPPPGPAEATAPRSERFRRIYEMADAGASALAIADALQIPLGEVELILGLRRLRK